ACVVIAPLLGNADQADGGLTLIESRRIWDKAPHNAFTDLVRFRDEWFCVFREGKAHVSPDGALRVLVSKDGQTWESAALITSSDSDLRDAKITVTTNDELMLCGAGALHDKSKHTHQSLAWFSKDGRTWGEPVKIGDLDFWLWRVTWHKGVAYGIGYGCRKDESVRLYTSRDGRKFDTLVERLHETGAPNESSLVFDGDTAYCLLRRDGKPNSGLLGISQAPYTKWEWKDLGVRIGGPHMLRLDDGRFLAAVRLYDGGQRTSLCWIDPKVGKLTEALKLPSGGDTSYAGLVARDGVLWVSYYSSHEKKTNIYLARVDLPSEVTNLGSRRELLVDDALFEQLGGGKLQMHLPEPRDVVITCDAPWEGNTSAYFTLFEDEGRYRMYYRGAHFDTSTKKEAHPEFACYAESRDGLTFEKPKLGLFDYQGSKDNNILWTGPGTHNFTPFKDGNPDAPAAARYKALASGKGGLLAFHSSDGIRWTQTQDKPVITRGAFDSQNLAFWDSVRREYRAYWRYFTTGESGSGKKTERVRAIRTATSKDFLTWTNEADLQYVDSPDEHLYTNAIAPYFRAPHLFIGFPTRFQPRTQQVEPVLMTRRDGVLFNRWPEPLIPITAPSERDGNRSNYMTSGLLSLPKQDREISVYATEAYYEGPGSRVRRFTFRTDGFVSLHAGEAKIESLTRPVKFEGKKLTLNAKAAEKGRIRVELQRPDGSPIPGYGLDDSIPFDGDEIEHVARWKNHPDLSQAKGQTVRLKFELVNADLYSLQFAP
ncbi:MAG: hypothetical protein IT428_05120, partial [Planctomycetaceae bacterium]|nr:hypothetical protein [Planctomycetaceae bacterium]